jgi:hypothetical protein
MQPFKVQALAQFGSLPAGVDLIVMRQEKMSAAKVAATAAKVAAAGTAPFVSPLVAASSISSVPPRTILPSLSSAAAIDYANIIQQLQAAVKVEAVASISYYRDMAFAAALCDEFGVIEAADGALANAAHYAAASRSLRDIVAGQMSPTSAETLVSLLAQAKHAVHHIEAGQAAATAAKDYSKAAGLEKLKCDVLIFDAIAESCHSRNVHRASFSILVSKAEALVQDQPSWSKATPLQRFSLPLQRHTTRMKFFVKKWFPRWFVLANGRLYYSDGKNGHSDSKEGTLSFVRSNPAADAHYCVELRGASDSAAGVTMCCF